MWVQDILFKILKVSYLRQSLQYVDVYQPQEAVSEKAAELTVSVEEAEMNTTNAVDTTTFKPTGAADVNIVETLYGAALEKLCQTKLWKSLE